ncbi:TPA: adenylate/guanylate cyclase domain-containing protein [Escherichia coli]|nr:adenylate/guanylate cyclase domain-containing protein [Escherichia coli]
MSIKSIYSVLDERLEEIISKSKSQSVHDAIFELVDNTQLATESLSKSSGFVRSSISLKKDVGGTDVQSYQVKDIVRNKFGKHGPLMTSFGCHPDFNKMDDGEVRNGYSITMFMDIIGSTKLGVVFPPEIVFRIKNDIIRCAIETVNAFDGHVHRIMGDAVMAFFRSNDRYKNNKIADSAIDAINCAVVLIEMFKGVVIPKLSDLGVDENLGIRIGLDYGPHEEVVWSKYGYMESHEVTATSFFVDVAAKLQQKAPKNSIMIGASFVELLGLDDVQLKHKINRNNGVEHKELYLTPNYKDASGKPINYRQYVFDNERYCNLLPINDEGGKLIVKATLKKSENDVSDDEYICCSRMIKKGMGISFKGYYYSQEQYSNPRFKFRVENTGPDAGNVDNKGNHESYEVARYTGERYFAKHWEDCHYKGLHYMFVSFWNGDQLIERERCFSVFIND